MITEITQRSTAPDPPGFFTSVKRRKSIDPPEVLFPLSDDFLVPTSDKSSSHSASTAIQHDEADDPTDIPPDCPPTEYPSNHVALVPYQRTPSPPNTAFDPPTTINRPTEAIVPHILPPLLPLDHCYVLVPSPLRLSSLFATLRRNSDRRSIIYFSSWESAAFHATLFRQLELLPVHEMHERTPDLVSRYESFLYSHDGVLFASEMIHEFEIPPNVDYLMQYEPPSDPAEYVERVCRARLFETSCRKSLLFLRPDTTEMTFLEYFREAGVPLDELQARRVDEFQERVEKLVWKHGELNREAWRAFQSYLERIKCHLYADVYDGGELEEEEVRKSFAMTQFPGGEEKRDEDKQEKEEGWRKGIEKTWRSGSEKKPWTNREKSWRHANIRIPESQR